MEWTKAVARYFLKSELQEKEQVNQMARGRLEDQAAELVALAARVESLQQSEQLLFTMVEARPVPTLSLLSHLGGLAEVDSQYQQLIQRLMANSQGYTAFPTEQDRLMAVQESRLLVNRDPVTERIISLWTDYGFGLTVQVTAVGPGAEKVWQEFWKALRNAPLLSQRLIQELSDTVLRDGEFWFLFFVSKLDGTSTLRFIPTDEITELIHDPQDASVVVYYKREWEESLDSGKRGGFTIANAKGPNSKTRYYRDWRISDSDPVLERVELDDNVERAEILNEATYQRVMHIAHRLRGIRLKRGWPLNATGAPWARAYKEFLENRAAVARAVAAFVDKLIVKGGSTELNTITARFSAALDATTRTGLTRAPQAGSTWTENEALTRSRMPLATGAGDARVDGGALLAQAGLPGGIPPHLLGRGEVVRMAVADAMDEPIFRQFVRYQAFWISVWSDLLECVLRMKERYDKRTDKQKFQSYEAKVDLSALRNVSAEQVEKVLAAVSAAQEAGLISDEASADITQRLLGVALQLLGITEAEDILKQKGAAKPDLPSLNKLKKPQPNAKPKPKEKQPLQQLLAISLQNMKEGTVEPDQVAEFLFRELLDLKVDGYD